MSRPALETLPGFRRRFRITPEPERVCCEVEDDYHCMRVTVHHDGEKALAVEPDMRRAPWTTCPGAEQKLTETFEGIALADFPRRGEKKENCTHLYDLALLAARHAFDEAPSVLDILVSDPEGGKRRAELRRDNEVVMSWVEADFKLVEPPELAGTPLFEIQNWLRSLTAEQREYVKLLRWGNMLANGRTIPMESQSDATKMPANCYTFQPQRAVEAMRVGVIRDFSDGKHEPLEEYEAFT